jgi:hypothetical protein
MAGKLLLSKMKELANSEKGKCYLIGNGGSLKNYNLSNFANRPSLACNFQFIHAETPYLDLRYYTHLDPLKTLGKRNSELRNAFESYVAKNKDISFFLSMRDFIQFRPTNAFHLAPIGDNWPGNLDERRTDLFSRHAKPLLGTLRGQINLAIFLGFSSATLVAHDYLLSPTHSGHFYEFGIGKEIELGNWNVEFLSKASQFIELEIMSPTPCKSSIPVVTYTDTFDTSPSYRENNEIISIHESKLLSAANDSYEFGYKLHDTET